MFAERVVGLRMGEVVYDGPPTGLTPEVLTDIYGEEDWESTIEKVEDVDEEEELDELPVGDGPLSRSAGA